MFDVRLLTVQEVIAPPPPLCVWEPEPRGAELAGLVLKEVVVYVPYPSYVILDARWGDPVFFVSFTAFSSCWIDQAGFSAGSGSSSASGSGWGWGSGGGSGGGSSWGSASISTLPALLTLLLLLLLPAMGGAVAKTRGLALLLPFRPLLLLVEGVDAMISSL